MPQIGNAQIGHSLVRRDRDRGRPASGGKNASLGEMVRELAKDGESGLVYLVQARLETVQSGKSQTSFRTWSLETSAKPIVEGAAVGGAIAAARASVIRGVPETGHLALAALTTYLRM